MLMLKSLIQQGTGLESDGSQDGDGHAGKESKKSGKGERK